MSRPPWSTGQTPKTPPTPTPTVTIKLPVPEAEAWLKVIEGLGFIIPSLGPLVENLRIRLKKALEKDSK